MKYHIIYISILTSVIILFFVTTYKIRNEAEKNKKNLDIIKMYDVVLVDRLCRSEIDENKEFIRYRQQYNLIKKQQDGYMAHVTKWANKLGNESVRQFLDESQAYIGMNVDMYNLVENILKNKKIFEEIINIQETKYNNVNDDAKVDFEKEINLYKIMYGNEIPTYGR